MKIVQFIIDRLVPFISDRATFAKIRNAVEQADKIETSGANKKQIVIDRLRYLGFEVAEFVFNALLELAVLYLRSKQGKI